MENKKNKKNELEDLNIIFKFIKKEFFPTWDKKETWKIIEDSQLNCMGACNYEKRTIKVNPIFYSPSQFKRLIIHEVCHAIKKTIPSHGESWRERTTKKAAIAERKGDQRLSDEIKKEVYEYKKREKIRPSFFYNLLREYLKEFPETNFRNLMANITYGSGYSIEEIEQKFPKSFNVYAYEKSLLGLRVENLS